MNFNFLCLVRMIFKNTNILVFTIIVNIQTIYHITNRTLYKKKELKAFPPLIQIPCV